MGRKRLTISLVANIVSYATSALVALMLTPFLISTVGKETYSFYPLANSLVLYVGVLGIALNSMSARFVTVAVARGNFEDANTYFSSVFRANLVLALALGPAFAFFVVNIERILRVPGGAVLEVQVLFGCVALAALIRIAASTLGIATFARDRLDIRAAADIGLSVVRLLSYYIMFSMFSPSVAYVGVVAVVVEIVSLVINLWLTRMLLPEIKHFGVPFSLSAVRGVVSSGVWNSVRQIGAIMLSSLALLLCNVFLGPKASGDYAIALTVPNFVAGFVSAVGAVFVPATTQGFAVGNRTWLVRVVTRAQKISGMLSSVIVGVYVATAHDFFALWVPAQDPRLLSTVSILAVVHLVVTGATWPVSNLNVAMNRVRVPAIAIILAGLISVGLVLLTLRFTSFGLVGIAISSLVPNLILVLLFVPLYPCGELGISRATFYPAVVRGVLSFLGVFALTEAWKLLIGASSWAGLLFVGLGAGTCGTLLSLLVSLGPRSLAEGVGSAWAHVRAWFASR